MKQYACCYFEVSNFVANFIPFHSFVRYEPNLHCQHFVHWQCLILLTCNPIWGFWNTFYFNKDTGQWPSKLKYINHARMGDQGMQYLTDHIVFHDILVTKHSFVTHFLYPKKALIQYVCVCYLIDNLYSLFCLIQMIR